MANTTFSGPVRSGTFKDPQYQNVGKAVLQQAFVLDVPALTLTAPNGVVTAVTLAAGAFNSIMYLPAGSKITRIVTDVAVVVNQGTSAAVTVGSASGGTQYMSSTDVKTSAGRIEYTPTAAQITAGASTAADSAITTAAGGVATSPLYLRLTTVGTAATTGSVIVTVEYSQQ